MEREAWLSHSHNPTQLDHPIELSKHTAPLPKEEGTQHHAKRGGGKAPPTSRRRRRKQHLRKEARLDWVIDWNCIMVVNDRDLGCGVVVMI